MQSARTKIEISIRNQRLTLTSDGEVARSYPVSTSRFGIGTEEGSMKTPLGNFRIAEKIGHDAAPGTIFNISSVAALTAAAPSLAAAKSGS